MAHVPSNLYHRPVTNMGLEFHGTTSNSACGEVGLHLPAEDCRRQCIVRVTFMLGEPFESRYGPNPRREPTRAPFALT